MIRKLPITLIIIILAAGVFIMSENMNSSGDGGNLDPETFKETLKVNPGTIIDVRTPEEYQAGHLEEADYQIDFLSEDFMARVSELDREKPYYLYCRSGARSGRAMLQMQDAGFEEVYNVGGYEDLVSAGFKSE